MSSMFYVVVFVATVLAGQGLYLLLIDRRASQAELRDRLRRAGAGLTAPRPDGEDGILRKSEVTTLSGAFGGSPYRALELRLYRAGLTIRPERFVILSIALGFGGFSLGSLIFEDATRSVLLLGLGVLPYIHVGRLARKRMAAFEAQFPGALELLTRALRAGHSLSFGLQMVGDELPDPIGTELGLVAEEVALGQDITTALEALTRRVDVPDLPFFVTAITIQSTTGGNLAEILDNLGHVIRERFKLYGKVRSLTAIGRASSNLLAAWPLVMGGAVYLANPDYISPLWTSDAGPTLVLISTALVVVGYALCRRMAVIKF